MTYEIDMGDLDRFTVGTIGEPGSRLFLLQAEQGRRNLTLKVEKQQVRALSDLLAAAIADLASPGHLPEDLALRPPLDVDWAVGSIITSYDEILDRLVLVIAEIDRDPDADDEIEQQQATLRVTREQAAAVAIQGVQLVEGGRPPCPLCGYPMGPSGHACPRTNGHRPPSL